MKPFLIFFCVLFLTGCITGVPGHISTHTSSFDGAQEVNMAPGHVALSGMFAPVAFNLGLHWNSSAPEKATFIAVIPLEIVNINSKEGLQFNLDGKIIKLSSYDIHTDFDIDSYGESSKRFSGSLDLIRQILEADSAMVKLVTSDGYLEGDLKAAGVMSAYSKMPDFLREVEGRLQEIQ